MAAVRILRGLIEYSSTKVRILAKTRCCALRVPNLPSRPEHSGTWARICLKGETAALRLEQKTISCIGTGGSGRNATMFHAVDTSL